MGSGRASGLGRGTDEHTPRSGRGRTRHTVQNPTEAAYARSDLFERRSHLMDEWAAYLAGGHVVADAGNHPSPSGLDPVS